MPDEQPSFIQNDQELLEAAKSIDPKVLSHFRLFEQPYRGGPGAFGDSYTPGGTFL
jgi:hypothetical protein